MPTSYEKETQFVVRTAAAYFILYVLTILAFIAAVVVSVGVIFAAWPGALLWLWALFAALAVGVVIVIVRFFIKGLRDFG